MNIDSCRASLASTHGSLHFGGRHYAQNIALRRSCSTCRVSAPGNADSHAQICKIDA